jgi:acetone carboxylase gamma subunit
MKCVCGYYQLEEWEIDREDPVFDNEIRKNNGAEKFIEVEGTFLIKQDYSRRIEVRIFACPRCKTLQLLLF